MEVVNEFRYLNVMISTDGGKEAEDESRIFQLRKIRGALKALLY